MTERHIEFSIADVIDRHVIREALVRYYVELMAVNQSVNLVSRETSRADFDRLCAESLLPLDHLTSQITNYLDIGSGGGIPAIPILLTGRISGESILVERTQKKGVALEQITRALALKCRVITRTFEETAIKSRFDLITLRYVKLDRTLLKKIIPLLAPGGSFVYYSSTEEQSDLLDKIAYSFTCPDQNILKHFTVFRTK